MATEKTIKLKVENGEAIIKVDELNKALKQTNKEADDLNDTVDAGSEALDKFTKGGLSAMKGLISGAKTAIGAMTSLKGAVISTGIGALVVVVASLAAYFTRTSRGADALAVIMGGLGAVLDKITQVAITLGETLFKAFQNPKKALADFGTALKTNITNRLEGLLEFIPAVAKAIGLALKGNFKEAGAVATDAVAKVGLGVENMTDKLGAAVDGAVKFGNELTEAARKGMELAEALDAVEDRERDLIVLRAKSNKEIAKARMIADDTTKSTEERIAAVQQAFKLEQKVANAEQANARAYLKYLDEKIKTETSNDDDLKARAEAQAKVLELETETLRRQKRLQAEVTSLKNEDKVALEASIKLREEAEKKELEYQAFIKNGERETIELINKTNAARVNALLEFNNQVNKIRGIAQTDKERDLAQIEADGLAAMRLLIESGKATEGKAAELEAAKREALRKVNEKYDKLDQQREMANNAKKLELTGQAFGALAQLSEAFSKGGEKNAKKTFAITKALRLGEAVANTAAAIMNQLASTPGPAGFVQAGIAAVTGAAQIATIAKSKFEGGKTSAETPSMGSSGSSQSAGGGGYSAQGATPSSIVFQGVTQEANLPVPVSSNSTQSPPIVNIEAPSPILIPPPQSAPSPILIPPPQSAPSPILIPPPQSAPSPIVIPPLQPAPSPILISTPQSVPSPIVIPPALPAPPPRISVNVPTPNFIMQTPLVKDSMSKSKSVNDMVPSSNLIGLGQNPFADLFSQPMQAYVVGQQMNNANMLERRIRNSATFGG